MRRWQRTSSQPLKPLQDSEKEEAPTSEDSDGEDVTETFRKMVFKMLNGKKKSVEMEDDDESVEEAATDGMAKVSLYSVAPGGGLTKTEVYLKSLSKHGVDFIPKRGRRAKSLMSYYSPFWMVVRGWGHPDPDNPETVVSDEPGYAKVTKKMYGGVKGTQQAVKDFLAGAGKGLKSKIMAIHSDKQLKTYGNDVPVEDVPQYESSAVTEATDARIGKFFYNARQGVLVYPFAKTKTGYKALLADWGWKNGKPMQKALKSTDFFDRGVEFYKPVRDPDDNLQQLMAKVKGHDKYLGESVGNLSESEHAEWVRVFDKLKSKQTVLVRYKSVMGSSPPDYVEFVVGRRSKSRKPSWWAEAVTILRGGKKGVPGMSQFRLWKSKDGKISMSQGDMAVLLRDFKLKTDEDVGYEVDTPRNKKPSVAKSKLAKLLKGTANEPRRGSATSTATLLPESPHNILAPGPKTSGSSDADNLCRTITNLVGSAVKGSYFTCTVDTKFGGGAVFVRYANVPADAGHLSLLNAKVGVHWSIGSGAFDAEGNLKGADKVKAEVMTKRGVKPRAKTGTMAQVAKHVAKSIKMAASVEESVFSDRMRRIAGIVEHVRPGLDDLYVETEVAADDFILELAGIRSPLAEAELSDRQSAIIYAFRAYKPAYRKGVLSNNNVTSEELAALEAKGLLKSSGGARWRLTPAGKKAYTALHPPRGAGGDWY